MDKCVESSDLLKTDRDFSVSSLYSACFFFPLFNETLDISHEIMSKNCSDSLASDDFIMHMIL